MGIVPASLCAGDTVLVLGLGPPGSAPQAVILEVRASGAAELDNGHCCPLTDLRYVDTGEVWLLVSGYAGRYLLSSHGKVVSLFYQNTARQRMLKVLSPRRYPSVSLGNGFGPQQLGLNRLVAQHFLPPPAEARFRIVIPRDGNPLNVRADNLRWADQQEQHDTTVLHYLHPCGERHPHHKLTHGEVVQIRALLAIGTTHQALAQRFGVSRPAISQIASGSQRRTA